MKIQQEIPRKTLHLLSSLIPIGLFFVKKNIALIILGIIAFGMLTIDVVRLNFNGFRDMFVKFFGSFIRHHELSTLTGATYLLLSAFIAILIFSRPVAILCLLFLTISDTFAAIAGIEWGKRYFLKHKTPIGTLSFLITALILAFVIQGIPLYIKIIGAVVATLVEVSPLPLDDNLSVPLISGSVMTILS